MSDYLWDGSGEPDEDIEHLERLLGELRHRQEPPAMPLVFRPRRAFQWPGLAVAATLVVAALTLGLWWGLRREESREASSQTTASLPRATVGPAPPTAANANESAPPLATSAGRRPEHDEQLSSAAARDNQRQRLNRAALERRRMARLRHGSGLSNSNAPATLAGGTTMAPPATPQDRIAGEQARAQLMLALQITSERLNFAQRRIQEQPAHAPALEPTQRERLR